MSTIRTSAPLLPQHVNELLLELALALQRYAMYPGGHPSLDVAVARVTERVQAYLERQPILSLGVARRQLVVEGVATDSAHPVLRVLAERLHHHRLGAVVFRSGLTEGELHDAMRALAEDPDRTGDPLGGAQSTRIARWPHVQLYRVTYEQLQLTQEEGDEADGDMAGATAQLWLGLARAASAQHTGNAEVDTDPDAVARAINEHPAARAYDQMIVGYLLELAEQLRHDPNARGAPRVRRRLSHLMRTLDPATLERLLAMGGNSPQRLRFLRDATTALQPDAVLELIRAAALAQGQHISTSMLRLLRKLSAVADDDNAGAKERAASALRDQVHDLLQGWSLADPNPEGYSRSLELMTRESVTDAAAGDALAHDAEPLRIIQMGIEVGAAGTTFWRAVDDLISAGGLRELMDIMDEAGQHNPIVASIWRRFEATDDVRRIVTTEPIDFESFDRILQRLPASTAISLLLDRIAESKSRATRMGVYRRLKNIGVPAVPMIIERLQDSRWFVARNMLALLSEIGSLPATFSPLSFARVEEAGVRREALQLAVKLPLERDKAICLALIDQDERTLRIGINAAREYGLPRAGIGLAMQRMEDEKLPEETRAALIRLLAGSVLPEVIERMTGLVLQRGLLGRHRLLDRTPEMLAALSVIAASGATDTRARTALQLARASSDPDIRSAAGAS